MGRDGRPDLEELGWKCLLLLEALVAFSQGVAERLQRPESLRGQKGRKSSGTWSEGVGGRLELEAELERVRRRLDILEQRCRDGGAAAHRVPESGGNGGSGRKEGRGSPAPPCGPAPARLDRASSRQRALQAALQLRREGKPVTLASVARAGGLKYSQVVYAFGRRGDLLREVEEAERAER